MHRVKDGTRAKQGGSAVEAKDQVRRLILPGVMLRNLFTIMATMSVPPVLPPWLKTMPMPAPTQAPPSIVAMKLSWTMGWP